MLSELFGLKFSLGIIEQAAVMSPVRPKVQILADATESRVEHEQ